MADDSKLIIGIDGDTKDVEKALANTEKSAKSMAASMAAEYRKAGLSQSEAMTKAWSEIERQGLSTNKKLVENTEKSAKQLANNLASEYRRAGLSQSEAMTKAWKEIEKQGLTSVQRLQVELHKLEKIGSVALAGLAAGFAAVGAGLAASVSVGAGFEHQMSAVEAISGATADQMTRLTAKAQEMGETSAFTATQAGQAFQFMSQAGWNTEAMLGGIEGIMDLAAASGQDLASTSDIVTDALTAFGLAASESGRFADVLAKASAKSNTDVGKMGYTFKYVAPLAGALKYSIEDTAVAIGLMANAGIKGEQAGTALRGIFTRLVKPTKDSEAAISALGLSITNADGTMKPLSDVILQMRSSFAGLTDEQKATYAAMLGGQEAMSGLLAIVNASDQDFANLTHEINNAAGSAKAMADIRLDNLTGQFTLFMSALEGVGITIYNSLSKPLTDSVRNGTVAIGELNNALKGEVSQNISNIGENLGRIFDGFISGVSAALPTVLTVIASTLDTIVTIGSAIIDVFADATIALDDILKPIGGLDTVLVGLISGFVALKAQMVFTAAIAAFTQLGGVIGLVTKAQLLLNLALTANPIGIVITAIGALVGALVYLYNTSDKARLGFGIAWEYMTLAAQKAVSYIIPVMNKITDVYNKWQEFIGGRTIEPIKPPDITATEAKIESLKAQFNALGDSAKKAEDEVNKLGGGEGGAGEEDPQVAALQNQVATLQNQLADALALKNRLNTGGVTGGVGGTTGKTGTTYKGFTQDAQGGYYAEDFVGPEIDAELLKDRNKASANEVGKGFAEDMGTGIQNSFDSIGQGVGSAITSALSGEKSWGEAFADIGKNLMTSLADSLMQNATDYLSSVIKSVVSFITSAFSSGFGIASPSKVFTEFGYWNIAGLAKGMDENAKLALEPIESLKTQMTNLMGGVSFSDIGSSLQPSLSVAGSGAMGGFGMMRPNVTVYGAPDPDNTEVTISNDNQGNLDVVVQLSRATTSRQGTVGTPENRGLRSAFGMKIPPNKR